MLKIFKNPDEDTYNAVTQDVKANNGYCPCCLERNAATKCICKEFREQTTEGECHCGRFIKREVVNE